MRDADDRRWPDLHEIWTAPDTALACLDETNKNMSHYASTTHMIVDLRTQLATQSQEIARLRERVGKLRAGLAGASKHCLCERFGPKGFDYGETHALLGRPKVGARWLTPPILIDAILAEDDRAAGEGGK